MLTCQLNPYLPTDFKMVQPSLNSTLIDKVSFNTWPCLLKADLPTDSKMVLHVKVDKKLIKVSFSWHANNNFFINYNFKICCTLFFKSDFNVI